ncbi:hypothetical protein SLA2020_280330 [Shorea laevis]
MEPVVFRCLHTTTTAIRQRSLHRGALPSREKLNFIFTISPTSRARLVVDRVVKQINDLYRKSSPEVLLTGFAFWKVFSDGIAYQKSKKSLRRLI